MQYKQAFITGATSGLGKSLSQTLAQKKISLLLSSRHENELIALQKELSPLTSVSYIVADLLDPEQMKAVISAIHDNTPDLVINAAGYGIYGDILSYPLDKQIEIIQVNATAVSQIAIEGARSLIKQGKKGTILNISSAAGLFTYPSFTIYAASKAFVTHFSLSFDQEVSPHGVRVLVCIPGQINTSFRQKASQNTSLQASSWDTMSVEKASNLIWKQIQKQKAYQVIDTRYRILCFLSRFLIPKDLLTYFLKRRINSRL